MCVCVLTDSKRGLILETGLFQLLVDVLLQQTHFDFMVFHSFQ